MKKYTIVGLHDADGSWEVETSPRVGDSVGFKVAASIHQTTANSDLIKQVYETLGSGKNGISSTRSVRTHQSGAEIAESKGVFNFTSPEGQKLLDVFKENLPLAPGKRRDYRIANKVFDFKNSGICKELCDTENNYPLKKDNITIKKEEVAGLSEKSKEKIGNIAMIYLKNQNSQSLKYDTLKKQQREEQMNNKINNLNPAPNELDLGIKLGRYYLVDINREQEELNSDLLSNKGIPNDYIIGMFLGDGWFQLSLSLKGTNSKIKLVPAFCIVQSSDCKSLLDAFKRTFNNKGHIYPDSPARRAYIYKLEGVKNNMNFILPLFDQYTLSSTKQKQYDLFKKVVKKAAEKQHLTSIGFNEIVDLCYDFSDLSQGQRQISREQMKDLGKQYFNRRNIA